MPIYDADGTANLLIKYIYDNDATSNPQIYYVYDTDNTTNRMIYSLAPNPLYLYNNGAKSQYGITPYADQSYSNSETSGSGYTYYYLVPWCAGVSTDRRASSIRTTSMVDVTPYTKFSITWMSHSGYGDAFADPPRCMWYLSKDPNLHGYNAWSQGSKVNQVDGVFSTPVTRTTDITGMSGLYYICASNYSTYGTSGVMVISLYLST